jgi:hypothetical protein
MVPVDLAGLAVAAVDAGMPILQSAGPYVFGLAGAIAGVNLVLGLVRRITS